MSPPILYFSRLCLDVRFLVDRYWIEYGNDFNVDVKHLRNVEAMIVHPERPEWWHFFSEFADSHLEKGRATACIVCGKPAFWLGSGVTISVQETHLLNENRLACCHCGIIHFFLMPK